MHRLKRPDAHLRVYLRALHPPVAQHRLYPPQVGPVLQHLRRHRMPEQVADSFVDACGSQVRQHGHRGCRPPSGPPRRPSTGTAPYSRELPARPAAHGADTAQATTAAPSPPGHVYTRPPLSSGD